MHLNIKAVKALEGLAKLSPATAKKKLGADLAKVLDDAKVKAILQSSKMKQGILDVLTPEQKAMIPPWVLELLQAVGPILLRLILNRLGIKLPV